MEDKLCFDDSKLSFRPLTPESWTDFEALFGENGACGGCWCMWWRLPRTEYERGKGAANKHAMYAIVEAGGIPGILAYADGKPVGWCSVAPRDEFAALNRSRILRPVDDQPVWSIVCFFVARQYRHQGVSEKLIRAAIDYAQRNGAAAIEAYPVEPRKDKMPEVFAFTGFSSAFARAGFSEVARRSDTRPVMRYMLESR